jgi:hypothetical protein
MCSAQEVRSLFVEESNMVYEFAIALVNDVITPVGCRNAVTGQTVGPDKESINNAPSPERFLEALHLAEWHARNPEVFTEGKVVNKRSSDDG